MTKIAVMRRDPCRYCFQADRRKEACFGTEPRNDALAAPGRGSFKTHQTCAFAHASAKADAYKLFIPCRRRLQPARPQSGGFEFCNILFSRPELRFARMASGVRSAPMFEFPTSQQ